jgi:hypothetical protein
MNKTLLGNWRAKGQIPAVSLTSGTRWGLAGGLVGTLVMDLVLMGALSAVGLPIFTCFSIVGNTVARLFSILGVELAGGIPLGVAAHYLIGPLIGAIFGAAVIRFDTLRLNTFKKGIMLAVLYVEIVSQPILATTPVLLKMTGPETWQWFGFSFVMHMIWGVVLGVVVSYAWKTSSLQHQGH